MAFARIKAHDLEWTRGEPSIFKSSNLAERGFCQSCGTPLTYRFVERDNISVSLGSLDHSQGMKPEMQFCHDAKASWLDELATVPVQAEFFTPELKARFINNQHPDHETR
jgi:hypothetical protein